MEKLASDIEKNAFNLDRVDFNEHIRSHYCKLYSNLTTLDNSLTTKNDNFIINHLKGQFKVVILGCTHYFFVKNKIFNHFQPQLMVRGETFTAKRVKREFQSRKILGKYKRKSVLFFGESASFNQEVFNLLINNSQKNIKILQKN